MKTKSKPPRIKPVRAWAKLIDGQINPQYLIALGVPRESEIAAINAKYMRAPRMQGFIIVRIVPEISKTSRRKRT